MNNTFTTTYASTVSTLILIVIGISVFLPNYYLSLLFEFTQANIFTIMATLLILLIYIFASRLRNQYTRLFVLCYGMILATMATLGFFQYDLFIGQGRLMIGDSILLLQLGVLSLLSALELEYREITLRVPISVSHYRLRIAKTA